MARMTPDELPPRDLGHLQWLVGAGRLLPEDVRACLAPLRPEEVAARGGLLRVLSSAGLLSGALAQEAATAVDRASGILPAPETPACAGGTAPSAAGAAGMAPKRIDRFEVLEQVGRGGMGVVYRAWDAAMKRPVALKLLAGADRTDREMIARFFREAQTAGSLRHPGIVAVHEVGMWEDSPYVVMEFVDGVPLTDRIAERGPVREIATLFRDIVRAVEHAHAHGVVHRDLKPGNILVDRRGRPCILDFGLARRTDSTTRMTAAGDFLGTPGYMPPEQIEGEPELVGPASDVFALGTILYEMLTGRPAFVGRGRAQVIGRTLTGDFALPREVAPEVPADLEAICVRCLAPETAHRYPDAGALGEDVGRFLAGEPVRARPPSAWSRVRRKLGRRRTALLVTATAAVAVVLGTGLAFLVRTRWEEGRKAREGLAQARKTVLVEAVLRRWGTLTAELRALDANFHDARRAAEERSAVARERWPPFQRFLDDTPGDGVSQATAKALAGWARRLALEEAVGAAWMAGSSQLDSDLPFGPLAERMVLLSRRLAEDPWPYRLVDGGGVAIATPGRDREETQRALRALDDLVAVVERARPPGPDLAQRLRRAVVGEVEAAGEEPADEFDPAIATFRVDLDLFRAQVLCLTQRTAQAIALLEKTKDARPGAPAVLIHLGVARLRFGHESDLRGAVPEADFRLADEAFAEALRVERGSYLAAFGRGVAAWAAMTARHRYSREGPDDLAPVLAAFETATQLDPSRPEAWLGLAATFHARARSGGNAPTDALAMLAQAEDRYSQALEHDPGYLEARLGRASTIVERLQWRWPEERDRAGPFRRALTDLDEVIRCDPDCGRAYAARGEAHFMVGNSLAQQGADSREDFRRAIADLGEAMKRDPNAGHLLHTIGHARISIGEEEARRGVDPREWYRQALEDHSHALERSATGYGYQNRARARLHLAQEEESRGGDADAVYRQAISDCDLALEKEPGNAGCFHERGHAWASFGESASRRGQEAGDMRQRALADFGEAVRLAPGDAGVMSCRAELLERLGRIAEAAAAFDAALALRPGDADLQRKAANARAKADQGK